MKFVNNIIEKLVERISRNFSEKFLESLVTKLQESFQEELGKSSKKWIFEKHGNVMVVQIPVGDLSYSSAREREYLKLQKEYFQGRESKYDCEEFQIIGIYS
jgi:hypothetical protein